MWYDELKEKTMWRIFQDISAIPRESGNEEGIRNHLMSWAKEHGLEAKKDKVGNVFIYVPASPGREDDAPICLQGHMDMVCVKREGSSHDFAKDPIEIVCDGGTVRAKDTSLGADNGIAIAMALAIACDKELSHPPLELLFTVSEETGLTGAFGLDSRKLASRRLINLDSEEEGIIYTGCAGGIEIDAGAKVRLKDVDPSDVVHYCLTVSGLQPHRPGWRHETQRHSLRMPRELPRGQGCGSDGGEHHGPGETGDLERVQDEGPRNHADA